MVYWGRVVSKRLIYCKGVELGVRVRLENREIEVKI